MPRIIVDRFSFVKEIPEISNKKKGGRLTKCKKNFYRFLNGADMRLKDKKRVFCNPLFPTLRQAD